jgi:hypothetical protein
LTNPAKPRRTINVAATTNPASATNVGQGRQDDDPHSCSRGGPPAVGRVLHGGAPFRAGVEPSGDLEDTSDGLPTPTSSLERATESDTVNPGASSVGSMSRDGDDDARPRGQRFATGHTASTAPGRRDCVWANRVAIWSMTPSAISGTGATPRSCAGSGPTPSGHAHHPAVGDVGPGATMGEHELASDLAPPRIRVDQHPVDIEGDGVDHDVSGRRRLR